MTRRGPTIELINTLVAQVIPIVMTSLTSGKKLPKLSSQVRGTLIIVAADRRKADANGRTINQIFKLVPSRT